MGRLGGADEADGLRLVRPGLAGSCTAAESCGFGPALVESGLVGQRHLLGALARNRVLVVCSGVKSILDVPATLEVLETASVPVLGYRTDAFPGFYRRDAGLPVPWRVDAPAEVADAFCATRLGGEGGRAYGTLPPGVDAAAIVERHRPLLG